MTSSLSDLLNGFQCYERLRNSTINFDVYGLRLPPEEFGTQFVRVLRVKYIPLNTLSFVSSQDRSFVVPNLHIHVCRPGPL